MVKEKSPTGQSDPLGKQMASRVWSPMDYYFDHLKETIASAPSGGTEFGEKIKTCAEQNISATQEYVRELTYAKDIQTLSAFKWSSCVGNWRVLANRPKISGKLTSKPRRPRRNPGET